MRAGKSRAWKFLTCPSVSALSRIRLALAQLRANRIARAPGAIVHLPAARFAALACADRGQK
eukprot:6326617-Heterocapsa_arctica.AAC.1